MKDRYEFDAVIHELKDRGGAYVICERMIALDGPPLVQI